MGHGFKRLPCCLEMPGTVLRATGQQIDSFQPGRVGTKRSRIFEDRQRFIKTAIIDLELRKLEETSGQGWRLRVGASQLAECPQCILATPGAQFTSGEIPLRERAARLDGIVGPSPQLLVRRGAFGPVELIELFEN